jgi:hypothetical protein
MSRSALAILGIAILVSFALWLSMRVAARTTSMELLPVRCRRRIQWWQGNERIVQFGCALVAVSAAAVQLGVSIG